MRIFTIQIVLACCLGLFLTSSVFGSTDTENLFEYAYASYGDGGLTIPWPSPPLIKVYQNGTVIFRKGDKIYTSKLDEMQLEKLKRRLESHPLLQQSQFVEVKDADMIGLHGGICYIRYLDGDLQIVLATDGLPKSGEWKKLIKLVEGYFPGKPTLYYPEKIELNIQKSERECINAAENTPSDWPFSERLNLASGPKNVEVIDPAINKFLFQSMYDKELLWFWWGFCETGKHYTIYLNKVPTWYGDKEHLTVGIIAQGLQRQWEKNRKK